MPFQSEKQRRFLWAEHPEIAKRWAHKYPESNKNLPMYADKKTNESAEKKAVLAVLDRVVNSFTPFINDVNKSAQTVAGTKVANSGLVKVDVPSSDKPTYAGEEREKGELDEEGNPKSGDKPVGTGPEAVSAIFGKLSAVLAQPLREMMEHQKALEEGRDPLFVPQNLNVRRYSIPSPTIAPPMGMTAPTVANPTPQPVQQPGNAQPGSPVGGGQNPQHNPIQAFGPLGAKGQLNGNAAFGQKNSPDSMKAAGANTPCSCGCGDTVSTCKCGADCKCRKPGNSCYRADKAQKAAASWDDDEYNWDDKPTRVLWNGNKPWMNKFDGKGPSDKVLTDYYTKGLNKYLQNPGAQLRAHYATWNEQPVPGPRRLFGLLPGKPDDGYNDMDYVDIAHGATPTAQQEFVNKLVATMRGRAYKTRAGDFVALGTPIPPEQIAARKFEDEHGFYPDDEELQNYMKGVPPSPETIAENRYYDEHGKFPTPAQLATFMKTQKHAASSPAWQRSEGKNEAGGLNEKGRKSYERETGGDLKAPVTESNPSGERAKRQNSFCSRMCGMKRVNTGSKTKSDPDSRINKSLRKWNCKCSSAYEFGEKLAGLRPVREARSVDDNSDTHQDASSDQPADQPTDGTDLSTILNLVGGVGLLAAPRLLGRGEHARGQRKYAAQGAGGFNPVRNMAQAEKNFLTPQRNLLQMGSFVAPQLAGGAVKALSGNPLYGGLTTLGTRGAMQYMTGKLNSRMSALDNVIGRK